MVDIAQLSETFDIKASGVLFWREGNDGTTWVLLARRTFATILGDAYKFSIPMAGIKEGEDPQSAAARAVHDELGLMVDKQLLDQFWEIETGGVSMHLYSLRVSSPLKPKCHGNYTDGQWLCLPPDCKIEDIDILTRDELKAFRKKLESVSVAV